MQNQDYYSDQGLVCPSFNAYTSPNTAETAAKVCREFSSLGLVDENKEYEFDDDQEFEDDDFEFVSFQKSADEVFFGDNARIGPVFPVFNRDLISQRDPNDADEAAPSSSSASSDVDELENVPAGSYCVWIPKTTPESSPSRCKKSRSTGTSSSNDSKRWRLRDLLRRSNSESRKDAFVLLTPALTSPPSSKKLMAGNDQRHPNEKMMVTKGKKSFDGAARPNGPNAVSMAHEVFYAKSKERVGYNKRQSYLPYRKDLVGFFTSVNAMGRSFPTF